MKFIKDNAHVLLFSITGIVILYLFISGGWELEQKMNAREEKERKIELKQKEEKILNYEKVVAEYLSIPVKEVVLEDDYYELEEYQDGEPYDFSTSKGNYDVQFKGKEIDKIIKD